MLLAPSVDMLGKRLMSISLRKASSPAVKQVLPSNMRMNPFAIYIQEQFQNVQKSGGGKVGAAPSMFSKFAKQWKTLDENTKQAYKEKSMKHREESLREFDKLSNEEKQEQLAASRNRMMERAMRKERKQKRKNWEETNHPAKPHTGFQIYLMEQFEMRKKNGLPLTPVVDRMREMSVAWKSMSSAQKESYNSRSEKLREEYKVAVAEWKKRVKAEESAKK